jgi:hypothetical protein
LVDLQTVEALQLRAPGISNVDKEFTVDAMRTGFLFPKLVNPLTRELVAKALLKIKCVIPSIKTMHENLKYLGVGATLLKRLLAGDCAGGTLRSTLKEQWKEPRDCLVEISPGVVQVARGFTPETCWDITYKQLWICVLREFADLGGRAPLKEAKERRYKAVERPDLIHGFVEFAVNSGIKPIAQMEAVDKMSGQHRGVGDTQSKSYINGRRQSASDRDDRRRRCGIPHTRAYKQGKAGFYLPNILAEGIENRDEMPSVSVIQRDFMDAFFGPTIDFRERLRDPPDESDAVRPGLDDALEGSSPSEDSSSLSEETLDMELSSSGTGSPQPSPTPAIFAMADTGAADTNTAGSEELSRPRLQEISPSALSSVVGSPELSPVASISPVAFVDRIHTTSRPSDEQDKPILEPTMTIVVPSTDADPDQGGTNESSPEPQISSPDRAPRQRDSLLTLDSPMNAHDLPFRPCFNRRLTTFCNTSQPSTLWSSISTPHQACEQSRLWIATRE